MKVSSPISQGSQRASHPCRVLLVCLGSSSFFSESDGGIGGFPCHLGSDNRKPGRTYSQAWGAFRCPVSESDAPVSGRVSGHDSGSGRLLSVLRLLCLICSPAGGPSWYQRRSGPSSCAHGPLCGSVCGETPPTDAPGDGAAFPLVNMPGLPGDPRLLPGPEGHGLLLRAWRWGHVTCLALLWPSPRLARLLFSSGNFREVNQYS